jgi:hypothetical protein
MSASQGAVWRLPPQRDCPDFRVSENGTVPFTASSARGWASAAALAVAVLVVCNVTLLAGRHTGRWDASDFFCPYFMLIADHARQGELLLWTPLVECGCPAGFDPEIGALSPVTVGLAALLGPSERAFCVYWLLIWAAGGLGVLLLARHYNAPRWIGCAAAIGYMFSAVFTGQAEYTAYLAVMALLPWTLWRLEVACQTWRLRPAAEAGALWGIAALSGYPGMFIIGTCYLAFWMFGRVAGGMLLRHGGQPVASGQWPVASEQAVEGGPLRAEDNRRRRFVKNVGIAVVFGAVCLTMLAPAYFGFLHEMRGYTDRSGPVPREEAVRADALAPKALATFASPYLAVAGTRPGAKVWWTDIAMCSIYLAPALVVLALAGLWLRPRDGFRWWLVMLGLLCLAAAVGGATPVRGWLYDLLPPMRYFRHAAMFRCFFVLTVVMLAILAGRDVARRLADRGKRPWLPIAAVGGIMAVAASATFFAVCRAAGRGIENPSTMLAAAAHLLLIWGGMTALALGVGRGVVRRETFGRLVLALCIFDAACTVVLSKPTLYGNRPKTWSAVEAAQTASLDLTEKGLGRQSTCGPGPQPPRNACLVSKTPVLKGFNVLRNRWYDALLRCPAFAASAAGADRVWFAREAPAAPLDQNTMQRLVSQMESPNGPCIVVSDPGCLAAASSPGQCGGSAAVNDPGEDAGAKRDSPGITQRHLENLPPAQPRPVQLLRYDDRCLEFDVVCPDDGWLLVTDRWAPSWRAWVNGVPRPVWLGNMVFRAVEVRRGANRVRFQYDPLGHPWSVAGSWLVFALVCVGSAGSAVGRFRRRGKSETTEAGSSNVGSPHFLGQRVNVG